MRRMVEQRRLSIPVIFAMVGAVAMIVAGCSGVETVPDSGEEDESYLELEVEPTSAEIFIDGEYYGSVDGWRHQTIPVEPGHRRLELRADGHRSQRLDVEVEEGRWVTIRTRLEPEIETPDGGQRDADDKPDDDDTVPKPPDHPAEPDVELD